MKKAGLIILIAALALGALGLGYAAWTTSLNINGTVNTASFNVTITGPGPNVSASSYSTVSVTPAIGPPEGAGPLAVTIDNAVPGTYTIPFVVTNHSSIPVTVTLSGITKTGPTGDVAAAQMTVDVGSFATTSLARGDSTATTATGTLTVSLTEAMIQGHAYSFIVPISAAQ